MRITITIYLFYFIFPKTTVFCCSAAKGKNVGGETEMVVLLC